MIGAVIRLLGGPLGTFALYGVAGLVVLMATGLGVDHGWTIPRLERQVAAEKKRADDEHTGRLADRTVAAEAARLQEAKFRQTEQSWAAQQEKATHEADSKLAAARADAAAATAAAGRLSGRLAALGAAARRTPAGAVAPAECAPAIAAVDLQSDVLGRMEAAGRQLAAYADAARVAGDACIAAWPVNEP